MDSKSLPLRIFLYRFLSFEAVVGTLLHELVHNSIDRHGPNFKKFLSKITEECEDVMIDKISLPAVESCGQILGGDVDAVGFFTQRELVLFAAECRLAERHSKHIIMNETVSEIVNIGGSENSEVIEID